MNSELTRQLGDRPVPPTPLPRMDLVPICEVMLFAGALTMHNWILVVTIFLRNDKDFFVQRPAVCDRIFGTYNLKLSGDRLFSRRRH